MVVLSGCGLIRGRLLGSVRPRRRRSTAAAAVGCPFRTAPTPAPPPARVGRLRPFHEIPSPRGWPLVGTAVDLLWSGGAAKVHEYCDRRHRELGPIFRDCLGSVEAVVIADKDYIQRVYFSEGPFPEHMVPEPWVLYNEMTGTKRGLFFMDGDEWVNLRKLLNQVLLTPQVVAKYGQDFNGVVTDLLDRWGTMSDKDEERVLPNLEMELYNWSIESLGMMVFGRRLGCVLPADQTNQMHKFVNYVQQIFTESAKMTIISPKIAYRLKLPVWRRFANAATNALHMAREYAEERIEEIKRLQASGQDVYGVLSQLLTEENITRKEIVNIVADLIIAAADTTSHATQWALYLLSKNPECQEELLRQIREVVRPGEMLTEDHLESIPYVMWIIKETLRLYPIASFLTRVLPEKIVLGDYEIPAKKMFIMSQYTIGRDPSRFADPEAFRPERWQRDPSTKELQTHGCMPFGVGARSCIGRRVAELQMRLLLARTVQRFHLESANHRDVGIALRMITTPDVPIRLRLRRRST